MLATGAKLGPYVVTALLGEGGMGSVYRAKDAKGGEVALKTLISDLAKDPRYVERFKREAQAAEAVAHRNVVRCVGSGEDQGTLWIAFELVPGGTLKELVRARGKLPWREVAALGAQIARGLAAIHSRGLVHRDVKPANVFLDASGTPKIGDLGLARGLVGKQTLTMSGELVGTFEYVAPEQTEHAKVDSRADLYSFGAVLYELVTGRPPFMGAGLALIAQHISAVPHAPRELVPGTPEALDALIRRLLAKQPEARGDGALAVAAELEEIARSKAAGRSRALVAGAAVAGVLAAAGALVPLLRARPDPHGVAPIETRRAPVVLPPVTPTERPPRREIPPWWPLVAEGDRPELPLPDDLEFGEGPGEYVNLKDGSVLVYVPGGTFDMGDNDGIGDTNPNPPHAVSLSAYFIGKYEVTNEQFAPYDKESRVATTGSVLHLPEGSKTPLWVKSAAATWRTPDAKRPCLPRHPVVQVVWADGRRYAAWAGLRLPTEAEWERAATWDHHVRKKCKLACSDENAPTPFANVQEDSFFKEFHLTFDLAAQTDKDGYAFTAPVGSFPHYVSPAGTLDMLGNVYEMCADSFLKHVLREADGVIVNPLHHDEEELAHIARGGAFENYNPRTTRRSMDFTGGGPPPAYRDAHLTTGAVGFRIARSAQERTKPPERP